MVHREVKLPFYKLRKEKRRIMANREGISFEEWVTRAGKAKWNRGKIVPFGRMYSRRLRKAFQECEDPRQFRGVL